MKLNQIIVPAYLLILFQFLLLSIYADTNGVWTYSADIQAGVFGADENNPTGSNYTFNDIVYFNKNIFFSANMSADNFVSSNNSSQYINPSGTSQLESANINSDLTIQGTSVFDLFVNRAGDTMSGDLELGNNEVIANRFVDSTDSSYFLNLSGPSVIHRVAADRYFSIGDNTKYLNPAGNSKITNLDIIGLLELNGVDINDIFVNEGQSNSISNTMLQDNAITTNKISSNAITINQIDTSSLDYQYVNRAGDSMTGDLNMGRNDITNVGNIESPQYCDENGNNCFTADDATGNSKNDCTMPGPRGSSIVIEHAEIFTGNQRCGPGGSQVVLKQCWNGSEKELGIYGPCSGGR